MAKGVEAGTVETDRPGGIIGVVKDYVALTKPPIIVLLIITAIGVSENDGGSYDKI
jgi:heme O synthase-like polyprenyltransferase